MTTSGRQIAVRRGIIVAIAFTAVILLPFALPAGAANPLSRTAGVTAPVEDGLLDTVENGADTVQAVGEGTPVQGATNSVGSTVTKTTGMVRTPTSPAPNAAPNPPQVNPGAAQPAPSAGAPGNQPPAALSDLGSITSSAGSALGLHVDAATLLMAREAIATPLVAEARSASPSALVLVAEPLARSLSASMGLAPDAVTTSGGTEEVQAVSNLPRGLLTEALIAAALLVAATAALVAELGLRRSPPGAA